MTVAPLSRAIKLYGTEEPRAKIRTLGAGPLSVKLEVVSLGAVVGEFGLAYRRMARSQPWYDDLVALSGDDSVSHDDGGWAFPLRHIVASVAGASAAEMLDLKTSAPDKFLGLTYRAADGVLL